MLSNKKIVCPNNLINVAKKVGIKEIYSFGDSLSSLLTKNSYFELNNLKLSTDNFSNSVNELKFQKYNNNELIELFENLEFNNLTKKIKNTTSENEKIFDPFMGSGTTAMVAKSLGRYYIGCELHEDYGNLIQERLSMPVKKVERISSHSVTNGLIEAFDGV